MAGITVDTLEQDRKDKLAALDKQYEEDVAVYDNALQDVDEWEQDQREMQNTQTATTVNRINESKEDAEKDYQKEQSAAYTDWQKMSNPYGVEAEKLASSGFTQATGYKGSLQVSMYNTYQNRLATARASYEQTVRDYDRMIEDAYASNNVVLAEIAAEANEKRLKLTLEAMEYENALLEELETNKAITKNWYDTYISQLSGDGQPGTISGQYSSSGQTITDNQPDTIAGQIAAVDQMFGTISKTPSQVAPGYVYTKNKTPNQNGFSDVHAKTDYYDGYLPQFTVNSGKSYGYFENSYQPKGIIGHGKLKESVDANGEVNTILIEAEKLNGETTQHEEQLWVAEDDFSIWYWDEREMMYIQFA